MSSCLDTQNPAAGLIIHYLSFNHSTHTVFIKWMSFAKCFGQPLSLQTSLKHSRCTYVVTRWPLSFLWGLLCAVGLLAPATQYCSSQRSCSESLQLCSRLLALIVFDQRGTQWQALQQYLCALFQIYSSIQGIEQLLHLIFVCYYLIVACFV